MDIVAPLLAILATFLQTYTSLKELGRARKSEVEWWITEDELVDEIPAWKPIEKRRGRRTLVSMRPADVDKEIRHMNRVLLGWVLLDVAAAMALVDAIVN